MIQKKVLKLDSLNFEPEGALCVILHIIVIRIEVSNKIIFLDIFNYLFFYIIKVPNFLITLRPIGWGTLEYTPYIAH